VTCAVVIADRPASGSDGRSPEPKLLPACGGGRAGQNGADRRRQADESECHETDRPDAVDLSEISLTRASVTVEPFTTGIQR
jgi:hypothetical protein